MSRTPHDDIPHEVWVEAGKPMNTDWEKGFEALMPKNSGEPISYPQFCAIRNFIRTKLDEAVNAENKAWLAGERCTNCGREREPDPLAEMCSNCYQDE